MYKTVVLFLFSFMLSFCLNSALAANIFVPAGTELRGELVTPLSSLDSIKGDPVIFKLAQNLIINNAIILEKGTTGQAIVTRARKATYFGQGGGIGFEPVYIKTINNVMIPLSFETRIRGSVQNDVNMAVATIGVGVFAALFHGKNHSFPAGTQFKMFVKEDTDLCVDEKELEKHFYVLKSNESLEKYRMEVSSLK